VENSETNETNDAIPTPVAVEKVEAFSQATGLVFSEIVRRALDAYLEREAPKVLEMAEHSRNGGRNEHQPIGQ
jgi:hypothetical protein